MALFFIEAKGQSGEFFRLYVTDVTDDEVQFVTADSQQGAMPLEEAFAFAGCQPTDQEFEAGAAVEVFRQSDLCWWPAEVQSIKGEFVACRMEADGQMDVAEFQFLRPRGHAKSLKDTKLHRCELPLCDDMPGAEVQEELQHLQRHLEGPCLPLPAARPPSLLSLSARDAERMLLIGDLLRRRLQRKRQLLYSIRQLHNRLQPAAGGGDEQPERHEERRQYEATLEFAVARRLVGLAIGAGGENVRRARSLPGVASVVFNDAEGVFRVAGDTADACESARRLLEFEEDSFLVPASAVGRLLGRNGRSLQAMINKCQLTRVSVGRQRPDGCVEFRLVGVAGAVADAKFVLEYHLDMLADSAEDSMPEQSGASAENGHAEALDAN